MYQWNFNVIIYGFLQSSKIKYYLGMENTKKIARKNGGSQGGGRQQIRIDHNHIHVWKCHNESHYLHANSKQQDDSECENIYHTSVITWAQSSDLMLEGGGLFLLTYIVKIFLEFFSFLFAIIISSFPLSLSWWAFFHPLWYCYCCLGQLTNVGKTLWV